MRRNMFGLLRFLDDEETEKLSRHMGTSEETKNRIFAMSERKVAEMKNNERSKAFGITENTEDKIDVIEVTKRPFKTAMFRTAAACAAVAVIGVGLFGVMRAKEPPASNIDDPVMAGGEESPDFVFTGDYSVIDSSQSESAAAFAVSTAETSDTEKAAKSSSSAEDKKASSSAVSSENAQSENESYAEETSSCDEETESGYQRDETDTESEQPSCITQIGITDSETVMKITKDMSYKKVMELLGTPNDLMMQGCVAQYIVDGQYLLLLNWDYDTDPVLKDGKELLESCPKITEMLNDFENCTFDCYVVDYNGEAIRVTCPQYDRFDCAVVGLHTGEHAQEWRELINRAMSDGRALRITHEDNILESYPPIVYPESIELAP